MKYRISAFLYYDATDGSLKLDDVGKSDTKLSITANALLYVLIQNPGVITRDYVMKLVWDDNGLTSSNSNLNQYISLLRKTFRNYGINNIIVTIPKGRLEINPALSIEILDDNARHPLFSQLLVTDELINIKESSPEVAEVEVRRVSYKDNRWAYITLFICAFGMFLLSFFSRNFTDHTSFTPVDHDKCDLLSTEYMINTTVKSSYITNFDKVRDKLGIICGENEQFLFYYGDKLQTNGLGRTFLAQCAKHEDNPFSYCENYFYYAWK